jgi:hypothetical protein
MRLRGINYDTGFAPWGPDLSRPHLDPDQVRHDMHVIRHELHCNAVRITGALPERIAVAAEAALEEGLAVWFSPFPCNLTPNDLECQLVEAAAVAHGLRTPGTDLTYVMGCEITMFNQGFLPGDDPMQRMQALMDPNALARAGTSPEDIVGRFQTFLAGAAAGVRDAFTGPLTYASAAWEPVDWTPFDLAAVDHYLDASNRATYAHTLDALKANGKPVVVTEFGCCTYRGADERGGMGWAIVDRSANPPRLTEAAERDEDVQANYLEDTLDLLEEAGVDGAFWFTFASYANPHRPEPLLDLDRAGYGVVKVLPPTSDAPTTQRWEPKKAFHALAERYAPAD